MKPKKGRWWSWFVPFYFDRRALRKSNYPHMRSAGGARIMVYKQISYFNLLLE